MSPDPSVSGPCCAKLVCPPTGLTSDCCTAVAFLESMGLPKPMLNVTRKQVEQRKLDFTTSEEYRLYARHNKPIEDA